MWPFSHCVLTALRHSLGVTSLEISLEIKAGIGSALGLYHEIVSVPVWPSIPVSLVVNLTGLNSFLKTSPRVLVSRGNYGTDVGFSGGAALHLTPSWWRHQMETFSALPAICVTGEFPAQRPVTRSFDAFFHLCLNYRLIKHTWGWWIETSSRPWWRHCNGLSNWAHTLFCHDRACFLLGLYLLHVPLPR